jgi:hypothetical protein
MNPGNVALIGEIEEHSNAIVNGIVTRLGGEVLRRPVDEIRREIDRANKAHRAAESEARRVMGEEPKA